MEAQQLNQENLNPNINIESQESDEVKSEEADDSSSECNEFQEDLMLLQAFRHRVKLEIEKQALALFNMDPSLMKQSLEQVQEEEKI